MVYNLGILKTKILFIFKLCGTDVLRHILDLPVLTHTKYLPLPNRTCSALEHIYCRYVRLIQTMLKTDNVEVKNFTKRSVCDANIIIGANLNVINRELKCVNLMVLGMSKI